MSIKKVSYRVFTCERCDHSRDVTAAIHYSGWATVNIKTDAAYDVGDGSKYHICPDCKTSLYQWMEASNDQR
jgi:hypothetical protein